jgi:aminoglycoside 6'-N-acetyltransferase I
MIVRPVSPADSDAWLELRDALWPSSRREHALEIASHLRDAPEAVECFVAVADEGGEVVGFVEVGLRDYAEGCGTSPVGYLEGIYVVPGRREERVGAELVGAAEEWARARGCTEMASDRDLDNEASGAFHEALGYEEVERIVCFRKSLEAA